MPSFPGQWIRCAIHFGNLWHENGSCSLSRIGAVLVTVSNPSGPTGHIQLTGELYPHPAPNMKAGASQRVASVVQLPLVTVQTEITRLAGLKPKAVASPPPPYTDNTALQAFVRHVMQVADLKIGHHDSIGAVVANVRGIDPDDLVIVQLNQERLDIPVGRMSAINHGTDAAAAQQFDPFADQIGIALHDHPLHIPIRPD